MTLHIYVDVLGGWRWRICAENGRIVADSAEAYSTHSNVKRAARRFLAEAPDLTVVDQTTTSEGN